MGGLLICEKCYYLGPTKTATKGNTGVEFLLWVSFIIPGIIYSRWRRSTRSRVCPECESPNIIPANSPKGKKLLADDKVWAPCGNFLEEEDYSSN